LTEQPAVQLSSAPNDVSCAQVVLHQPEYAGPCVQGGADVMLGGLEKPRDELAHAILEN
jgi:hypothetical protein